MKTIKERAKELNPYKVTESIGNCLSFNQGVQAGVKIAEDWVSIEEELPEIREKPYQVLVKTSDDQYDVIRIIDEFEISLIKEHFDFWRPINRK